MGLCCPHSCHLALGIYCLELWVAVLMDMTFLLWLNLKFPKGKNTHSESESPSVMSDSSRPHGLYNSWTSPGQNTGVGSLSLLQGIFLTHGSNPGLPICRWILYQLSHNGRPRVLEWVAYPFSSRSSQPKDRTQVSHIADRLFTS